MTESSPRSIAGHVLRLIAVERTCFNLEAVGSFYQDVLGFAPTVSDAATAWDGLYATELTDQQWFRAGNQRLRLTQFRKRGQLYPEPCASNDLWFQHIALVTPHMSELYARLQNSEAVSISRKGPEFLPPSTGSVTAFKFRDPEQHPLELISFPTQADAISSSHSVQCVTGYDHTAIVARDRSASLAFYTGALGMTIGAETFNRGIEQERLDNLDHDVVNVIGIRCREALTPHLELLIYATPLSQAPKTPLQYQDIAADRIIFEVDSVAATLDRLAARKMSPCILCEEPGQALLRDPDGHLLVLTEAR